MLHMIKLVELPPGARLLDLGGTPEIWRTVDFNFQITFVNLPDTISASNKVAGFTYIEHDACDLKGILEDHAFDFVFSNSTIEHVGDASRQEQFAHEVQRLAPAYWVQTPSDQFPFEVHTWVPFYWSLPSPVQNRLKRNWKHRLPKWAEMIEGTRVLSRRRMGELFPGAKCYIERLFGLEKSYSFYRPVQLAS